jgi:DNA invertase Pin-like site-specific DNA recombinase
MNSVNQTKQAIAYLRFSSDSQADGNSLERQSETIQLYAERTGLQIVETFTDEGFSASKGHHVTHGKMGQILKDADAGKYRGCALIVEKDDRFSRLTQDETYMMTRMLIHGGMEIHFAATSQVIRDLNDLPTIILAAVNRAGAKAYTDNLKLHIVKAKESRKDKATNGWILSKNTPWWIRVVGREYNGAKIVNPGRFEAIEERAAVVREIFKLSSQGVGAKNIAKQLANSLGGIDGCIVFVVRTLKNRQVLGEFTPAGREPISGYFPAIIDHELWQSSRSQVDQRRRAWHDGNKRKSDIAHNLFPQLVWDAAVNRPFTFQKVQRGSYLRTNAQKGEKVNTIRYGVFESAMLAYLTREDWGVIAGEKESASYKQAKQDLEAVLRDMDKISRRIQANQSAMDADDIDAAALKILAGKLAKDESAIMTLEEQKVAAQTVVETEKAKCAALYKPEDLLSLVQSGTPDANDTRLKLRAEIKKRIERVSVLIGPFENPEGEQLGDRTLLLHVKFVNGASRLQQVSLETGKSIALSFKAA